MRFEMESKKFSSSLLYYYDTIITYYYYDYNRQILLINDILILLPFPSTIIDSTVDHDGDEEQINTNNNSYHASAVGSYSTDID